MKVVEEAAAAADHGEEAAAGGEVLDGLLEVGGEVVDPVREDGDLDVRGAGVLLVQAVAGDDLTFRGGGHLLVVYPMKNCFEVKALRNSKFEIRNSEKGKGFSHLGVRDGGKLRISEFGISLSAIFYLLSSARRGIAGSVAVLLAMVSVAAAQEGGWKEDLKRMGFDEVPIEEMEKGEVVGSKWLAGGGAAGIPGGQSVFPGPRATGKGGEGDPRV